MIHTWGDLQGKKDACIGPLKVPVESRKNGFIPFFPPVVR